MVCLEFPDEQIKSGYQLAKRMMRVFWNFFPGHIGSLVLSFSLSLFFSLERRHGETRLSFFISRLPTEEKRLMAS